MTDQNAAQPADANDASGQGTPAPQLPTGTPQLPTTSGFMKALFDFSFRSFIIRRLAGVFFMIGLAFIALGTLIVFFTWVTAGIAAIGYQPLNGILLLLGAIVLAPLGAFASVVILRVWIETVVAVVAVAENTRQTAENTQNS